MFTLKFEQQFCPFPNPIKTSLAFYRPAWVSCQSCHYVGSPCRKTPDKCHDLDVNSLTRKRISSYKPCSGIQSKDFPPKLVGQWLRFQQCRTPDSLGVNIFAVSGCKGALLRYSALKRALHALTDSYKPSKPGAVPAAYEKSSKNTSELNSCKLACLESNMPKRFSKIWSNLTRLRLPLHCILSVQAWAL